MLDRVLNQTENRKHSLVVVCAWCNRQRVMGPDLNIYWIENKTFGNDDHVTHTICPTCKAKMTEQLHVIP